MLVASVKIENGRFSVTNGPAQTDLAKIRDLPTVSLLSISPDLKYLAVSAAGAPSTICMFTFADGFGSCIKRHVKEVDVAGDKNIDDFAFVDKSLQVDFGMFQKLQRILSQLEDRKVEIRLEFDHTVRVVQQRHVRSLDQ